MITHRQQAFRGQRWRSVGYGALFVMLASALACDKRPAKERLYFNDLIPPAGVGEVTIVKDEALNPATGGVMMVIATVDPAIDRDDLDMLMRSFYRQAAERQGFRGDRPAERIELRFYAQRGQAEDASDAWLGHVLRPSAKGEPDYTNRQRMPLERWTREALGNQPQFSGALKPVFTTDAEALSLKLTLPLVTEDGSGRYADEISFVRAMREFSAYAQRLFDKIAALQQLTFIALHRDAEVLRIWLSREQYGELKLGDVDEALGEISGAVITELITAPNRAAVEQRALRQLAAKEREIYRDLLKKVPPEQVVVGKALR